MSAIKAHEIRYGGEKRNVIAYSTRAVNAAHPGGQRGSHRSFSNAYRSSFPPGLEAHTIRLLHLNPGSF
ncbi:hypothetical protein EYF80_040655 [Liparis tanakae]|uniref:Uncharacterized protein n=1 Tax=Liparis tanakae TaxID=230148 RepID=A0A4Z2G6G1_9TELE|nr:hypothetical protein EYF80_040655 [Liparis tanakae]